MPLLSSWRPQGLTRSSLQRFRLPECPGGGERSSRITEMRSAFFRAVARLNLLLRGVLRGHITDERFGDGLVGRIPIGDDFPALAVPLLYPPLARALVVGPANPSRFP